MHHTYAVENKKIIIMQLEFERFIRTNLISTFVCRKAREVHIAKLRCRAIQLVLHTQRGGICDYQLRQTYYERLLLPRDMELSDPNVAQRRLLRCKVHRSRMASGYLHFLQSRNQTQWRS